MKSFDAPGSLDQRGRLSSAVSFTCDMEQVSLSTTLRLSQLFLYVFIFPFDLDINPLWHLLIVIYILTGQSRSGNLYYWKHV